MFVAVPIFIMCVNFRCVPVFILKEEQILYSETQGRVLLQVTINRSHQVTEDNLKNHCVFSTAAILEMVNVNHSTTHTKTHYKKQSDSKQGPIHSPGNLTWLVFYDSFLCFYLLHAVLPQFHTDSIYVKISCLQQLIFLWSVQSFHNLRQEKNVELKADHHSESHPEPANLRSYFYFCFSPLNYLLSITQIFVNPYSLLPFCQLVYLNCKLRGRDFLLSHHQLSRLDP